MFPEAKDYIKFLREEFSKHNNLSYTKSHVEKLKIAENDCIDYSNSIYFLKTKVILLKKIIGRIYKCMRLLFLKHLQRSGLKLNRKNKGEFGIIMFLGVPKNKIAPRLNEDRDLVLKTINDLQKEFLNEILKKVEVLSLICNRIIIS